MSFRIGAHAVVYFSVRYCLDSAHHAFFVFGKLVGFGLEEWVADFAHAKAPS